MFQDGKDDFSLCDDELTRPKKTEKHEPATLSAMLDKV